MLTTGPNQEEDDEIAAGCGPAAAVNEEEEEECGSWMGRDDLDPSSPLI